MALFGTLEPREWYFYHYTTAATLSRILIGQTLRLGPYSQTNDPREARSWFPTIVKDEPDGASDNPLDDWWPALDARFRERTKVACLTQDRVDRSGEFYHYHRGFARPRMWDQYADKHRGACVILDARAVLAEFDRQKPNHQVSLIGPVVYRDEPIGGNGLFEIRVSGVTKYGLDGAADRIIAARGSDLFFSKNTDWEQEAEFRLLAVNDDEETLLDISTALRGVVLGDRVEPSQYPVFQALIDEGKSRAVLARLSWMNGNPTPLPALP